MTAQLIVMIGGAVINELASVGFKELEKLYKGESVSDIQAAKENLKNLEKAIYEMENSREYDKKNVQVVERLKQLNKERNELTKKYNLSKDEINYESARGRIEALDEKAKYGVLTEKQKLQLAASKNMMHNIKAWDAESTQPEGIEIEGQKIKASITGSNKKKKPQQEASTGIQIEAGVSVGGNEIMDNLKKREEAMKNLAEFDERMRISSLSGEEQKMAQLLANYEKQKAEIKAMHEAQLFYAEDEAKIKEEQQTRIANMEAAYQAEVAAINEKSHQDKIAKEEQLRSYREIAATTEAERIALQKEGIIAKYDEELRKAEGNANLITEIERAKNAEIKRMEEQLHQMRLDQAQQYSDTTFQVATAIATLGKSSGETQKAIAISQATINTSLAATKAATAAPFPLNVALVAGALAQGAAQIATIKAQKFYTGGMIPGMNTLLLANEQGREAILNTRAVRAVGGEAGVNALNSGMYNSNNSYDNRQTSTIVINTSIMTQKAYRDEIEPILKRAERRR